MMLISSKDLYFFIKKKSAYLRQPTNKCNEYSDKYNITVIVYK